MPPIVGQGQCATCPIRQLSIFAELADIGSNENIRSFRPTVMTFAADVYALREFVCLSGNC